VRFFLGYYPKEIAAVARCSRQAVEKRLQLARTEARTLLENPGGVAFLPNPRSGRLEEQKAVGSGSTVDFIAALQQAVFSTCQSACRSARELRAIYYQFEGADGIDYRLLAHLASCPACLDEVNRMLGLPLLRERCPTDTIGSDQPGKSGRPGPPPGIISGAPGAARGGKSAVSRYRQELKSVVQHMPRELHVSVNGFLVGSQTISSGLSEQRLSIQLDEKIGFVEVHSEQGVRLMFVNVEQPPDGAPERTEYVNLSEGRTINLALSFAGAWPLLQVSYRDPNFEAGVERADDIEEDLLIAPLRMREIRGSILNTKAGACWFDFETCSPRRGNYGADSQPAPWEVWRLPVESPLSSLLFSWRSGG
jgi:hypothetical protein